MDLLIVLSWIGVFALSIGTLISLLDGGFLAGCLGLLLTSLTISTLIPLKGKLRLMVGGSARIFLLQRLGGLIAGVGCWVLVGIGGWEFVPAGVVMSVAAAWWPVMKIIERRRDAGSIRNNFVGDGVGMIKHTRPTDPIDTKTPDTKISTTLQSPPPNYTSTVTIIIDEPVKTPTPPLDAPIKIQTPIFNV